MGKTTQNEMHDTNTGKKHLSYVSMGKVAFSSGVFIPQPDPARAPRMLGLVWEAPTV